MLMPTSKSLTVLSALLSLVAAAPKHASLKACQRTSTQASSACTSTTITVGKSGNPSAQYNSIQSAINSLPHDTSPQTILILPGNYTEQLNVTRPGPLTLLGQSSHPETQGSNSVNVIWSSANPTGSGLSDNAFTSTLTVAPNLAASLTGSGPTGFDVPKDTPFGNTDFRAYNINFWNNFAPRTAGPALAVSISRANAGFYNCGIYSYQDTVYIGKLGNALFYGSDIGGQTDFLYGFGTALIEHSKLSLRGCGGGIIAWKGTNTTFANKYGAYVSNSRVVAANASIAASNKGKCALGRPWNSLHRSVYINTFMDATILPAGYIPWSSDPATSRVDSFTFMAEYNSSGPGFNLAARVAGKLTKELTADTVKPYKTATDIFMNPDGSQPNVAWIDTNYLKL